LVQETLALTRRLFIQLQRRPSTLLELFSLLCGWFCLEAVSKCTTRIICNSQSQFLGAGVIVLLPLLERLMLVCR